MRHWSIVASVSVPVSSNICHRYAEHEKYEYETPGWQCGTNYFTQVVWKATEEVESI